MSRLGRSQPIQPFAGHGFLGNTPANGVLPGKVLVVEPEDRLRQGRRRPALDPVVGLHGFLGNTPANGVLPRPISVVPLIDERRRQLPSLPPITVSGTLAVVAPPTTAPPAPTNVDRVDQRTRFLPLPPTAISGALQAVPGAFTSPPAPFVVPLDERRRFLAALTPQTIQGFDDAQPPQPNVVEPDDRKRRSRAPIDPTVLSAALAGAPPPTVLPTGPFVVPLTERNRLLAALPTLTISHGFVDPGPGPVGTTPPPTINLDRVDQRTRYRPLDPVVITAGFLSPPAPPSPPIVLAGTDWASAITSW